MNNEKSINALLRDNHFRIPIYQRSYVWTKKNWDALWKDIRAVVDGKYHKHFIGSIIYSKEPDDDAEQGKDNVCLVIDGQQRLTTFTIVAAAICYWLSGKEGEDAKYKLRDMRDNYLFKETSFNKEPRFRLRPADSNDIFFKRILDPLRLQIELPTYFESKESQIYAAFNYFKEKIEEYANETITKGEDAEAQQIDRIIALVSSAFEGMRLIEMKLDDDDDSQRIFECMNYRGQALEQSDLIRNYVLQEWDRETRTRFLHDYWHKIEDKTKDQHAKKKTDEDKLPEFFRDYLSMRESKTIKERDIFHTFRDGIKYDCMKEGKRFAGEMELILQEIRRYSIYYGRILNSRRTIPDGKFDADVLKHLWYINQIPQASTTYPFLLRLLDDYAEHQIIDKDTLIACLEAVQSYMVRCIFCNRRRKSFSNLFSSLYCKTFSRSDFWDNKYGKGTGRLKKGMSGENYLEFVKRGFGARTSDEVFPSNDELNEHYQQYSLYRNTKFCRYVLLRLEEKMSGKKSDTLANEEKLTVEHIFPQTPNAKWAGRSSSGLTQTIGNLTLTTQNSEMKNNSFAEKKKIAFDESGLRLNKYLAELSPQIRWNGDKIRERSESLYKELVKIWKDIPKGFREVLEPDEIPIKELDTEDFSDSEFWQDKKPTKISYIKFGEIKINGRKYPGRKKWEKDENELPPAWDTPDGKFYNEILQCLYAGHEGTFDNTSLGDDVGLEKTEEESGVRFAVPHEVIEGQPGRFAIQTIYAQMWQNIKRAAEETGGMEKLRIRFDTW